METATQNKVQNIKGGEFIIKDLTIDDVFTNEDFNEEQSMIRDMAKDFMEKEVLPLANKIEKLKDDHSLSKELMEKAGALGLLGTAIPEAYGGVEMDSISGCIVAEQVGRVGSFSTTFVAHQGIGTLPILYFGTEEQKLKYLPGLATGKMIGSYCLTEPSSGSDALGAKSTAVLSEDGKEWILNGQKMWITNSGFADVFIVFAKIDGKEFTAFLVDKGTDGLSLGAEEDKMGIHGSSTRQVFFENCRIPVENILGERGKGHKIAFNILNIGRYKLGVTALGGSKESLNNAIKYANDRHQFNQPISNFGAIKFKLAEMAIQIFVSESVGYRCAKDIEDHKQLLKAQGANLADALLGGAEEYSIECALVKVIGSEILDYVVDEAVQIYGGMGFSEETPVARAYRDARISRIYEGTNEINRLLAIDMLLKKAMKGQLDLLTPGKALQKELMSIPTFNDDADGTFAAEEKVVKNLKKAFLLVAGSAVQKLMAELKNEQMIIMNAADMLMAVYSAESILLRVKKIHSSGGDVSIYKNMLEVFLLDIVGKVNKQGNDALMSFASGDELKMMQMGLKRWTKYKNLNVRDARIEIANYLIDKGSYTL